MDMHSTGCVFTWSNKQEGEAQVFTKIDRVMINQAWVDAMPHSTAIFLPEGIMDH